MKVSLACLACEAKAPIMRARILNQFTVTLQHELPCPFLAAIERGHGNDYILEFGYPIEVVYEADEVSP